MMPRPAPLPEGLLTVGRITGCYGIKGWLRVHPYTDRAESLLDFPAWWLGSAEEPRPVVIDAGRRQGRGLVVHLRGIDDRNAAEALRGAEFLVRKAALPPLEHGEYYWHQLEGLEVWCLGEEGEQLLGRVAYLLETGANDVLVVRGSPGSIDDRERLLPYLPGDVVKQIDLEAGRLTVDWYPEA
ncbi:ribosome maturation factor RimM [Pseudohaliea rubra]|nr:ribosome maturation factor RimM [Pseudohaliea rubra]